MCQSGQIQKTTFSDDRQQFSANARENLRYRNACIHPTSSQVLNLGKEANVRTVAKALVHKGTGQ